METAFEAFDNCEIKNGMTVIRKGDKHKGRGIVQNRRAVKKWLNGEYRWVVRCTVAWEGATNGAQRFHGGKWNITTTVRATSLEEAS